MRRLLYRLVLILLPLSLLCQNAAGQFKSDAFSQSYNNDTTTGKDSVDVLFSFKDYFGGLAHKNDIKIGTMFGGSAIFVGGNQIYNKQYWKLPIVYGGIGAGVAGGLYYGRQGDKKMATWSYVLAGATYWAAMMDGVINYTPNDYPQPGKATLYSLLCPCLGQIYNREYWKIPIYLGGIAGSYYYFELNRKNYNRYRDIYLQATSGDPSYDVGISAETALYYRNVYRRYRDYAVVAIAAFYFLQVIDANVFAYMHDFEVSDDLALSVSPALIPTDNAFAYRPTPSALGLRLGFSF